MENTNNIRFTPIKCPICNGFGTVKHGQLICNSCSGKGFVVIDQETGLPVEQKREIDYGRLD